MGNAKQDLKTWAIRYARMGLAVFPLKPNSKVPATPNGVLNATTDEKVIATLWDANPFYNIGIACGKRSKGLVVVDIDQHGKDGMKSLQEWLKQNGKKFNPSAQVTTGGGGLHIYYFADEDLRNRANVISGVDIRADGGYVVGAPSVHESGNHYEWHNDFDLEFGIRQANQDVIDFCTWKAKKDGPNETIRDIQNGKPIPQGTRVDSLFRYACKLIDQHLPEEAVRVTIKNVNDTRCNPPLSDEELERTVFTAFKRGYIPTHDLLEDIVEDATLDTDEDFGIEFLSDIEEREVQWLVPGWMPKGQINVLCGTGGVGKTTMWCSLIASITTGRPTIFEGLYPAAIEREPQRCMFFTSEDAVPEVLSKRLRMCGADMSKIITIQIDNPKFDKVKMKSKFLRKLIAKYKPALVVFDPLQSFVDAGIKLSDRNAVRDQTTPLLEMGKEFGTTFLIIMHSNKQKGVYGRARMADSSDMWDVARSVIMVGKANDEGTEVYASHEKCNYARPRETAVLTNNGGMLAFKENTNKKDREYVLEEASRGDKKKAEVDDSDLCTIILTELANADGKIAVDDIDGLLLSYSYSIRSIKRAKAKLKEDGRIILKKEGMGGKFYMYRTSKK